MMLRYLGLRFRSTLGPFPTLAESRLIERDEREDGQTDFLIISALSETYFLGKAPLK